jgi:tRNA A-37 threonylcarbamoyl transferase component Bud32
MDKNQVYHTDIQTPNIILMDPATTSIRLIDFGKAVLNVGQHPRINKVKGEGF